MCVCECVCVCTRTRAHVYTGRCAYVCLQDVYTEVGLLILHGVSLKTQWGQVLLSPPGSFQMETGRQDSCLRIYSRKRLFSFSPPRLFLV